MASEEFVGEGENRQRVEGRILETVRYTAFGVPQVFRRLAADIADDTGVPLDHGQRTLADVGNSGVNDGDYNAFFAADGYFYQSNQGAAAIGASCDVADDAGNPLSNGMPIGGATNSGVNEGDYNCFFNYFGDSRRVSTEQLYNSADPNSAGSTLYEYGELSFPEHNNRIGYCGYWWDPHLQMYLVRNRWYTPREGRWLTPDPIGYAGGRNLYQYCENQPWLYTDPMGLSYQLYGPLSREQMAQLRQAAPGTRIGERGVTGAVFSGLWQGGYDGLIVTSNVAVNTLTLGHVGMTRRQLEAEGALYDNETPGLGVSETAGKIAGASTFAAITLATFGFGGTAAPGTTYVFTFTEGAFVSSVSNAVIQRYEIQNGDRQSFSITSNVVEALIGGGLNVAFRAVAPYLEKVVGRMFGRAADDAASATAGKLPTNPAGKSEPCGGCPDNPGVTWVDENASMSLSARQYQSGASGARSNISTQESMAPSIDGPGGPVRFDGEAPGVLIDRKTSVVLSAKMKNQAVRQSAALRQNNLRGRWEVPTEAEARRAIKMFEDLGIDNIDVKVVPK